MLVEREIWTRYNCYARARARPCQIDFGDLTNYLSEPDGHFLNTPRPQNIPCPAKAQSSTRNCLIAMALRFVNNRVHVVSHRNLKAHLCRLYNSHQVMVRVRKVLASQFYKLPSQSEDLSEICPTQGTIELGPKGHVECF